MACAENQGLIVGQRSSFLTGGELAPDFFDSAKVLSKVSSKVAEWLDMYDRFLPKLYGFKRLALWKLWDVAFMNEMSNSDA